MSLIGTEAGNDILKAWADVAPVGWGESHAAALIDAVRVGRCSCGAAAALIGSTNDTVALLHKSWDIALAIRCWGQATPDVPTAWMTTLTQADRDRLLNVLSAANINIADQCLPWLPKANASDIAHRIERTYLDFALDAYAAASSIARTRHADVLSTLMQHSEPSDLAALTRLAVASGIDAAWTTVVQILHEHPDVARHVVAAAPWDDVPGDVQVKRCAWECPRRHPIRRRPQRRLRRHRVRPWCAP